MNCIAVIACLGLLCGTVFASDVPNCTGVTHGDRECLNGTSDEASKDETKGTITNQNNDAISEYTGKNSPIELGSKAPSAETKNPDITTTDSPTTPTTTSPTIPTTTSPTIPTTTSPTIPTTTTPTIPTTTSPTNTTPTTTPKPTSTTKASPTEPPTTATILTTTTTQITPTLSPSIPTKDPVTTELPPTAKPAYDRRFDGPSFIGGIVFALGVTAIAFVAWKFYKARTERNYHTL